MLLEHGGLSPQIDPTAYVAPNATVCGDVRIGAHCRILFGAVLTAETGPIDIGDHVVIMENAVVRGSARNPVTMGSHTLVGPRSYVSGAHVGKEVFLATGSSVFNGAHVGDGSEVRINGTVHLRTHLPSGSTVPIGWVAVGEPALILPPECHADIWAAQKPLDFPGYVFGVDRQGPGANITRQIVQRYVNALSSHTRDQIVATSEPTNDERHPRPSRRTW